MRNWTARALALAGALLFLATGSARAQTQTTVTGTIVDPQGIPYAGGTYSIQLIPAGTPTVNGNLIGGAFNGSLDSSGKFTIALWPNSAILPASSQWQFTICITPGVLPPLGTGGQCTPPTPITITSPGPQDVSSTLNAVAPRLTILASAGASIGGTIAVPQVAFATAPNTIGGDPNFTYTQTGGGFIGFSLTPNATGSLINIVNEGPIDARGIPGVIIQDMTQGGLYFVSAGGNNVGGDFGIEIRNIGSGAGDGGTLITDQGTGGMQIVEAGGASGAALTISNTGTGVIDLETSTGNIDLNTTSHHLVSVGGTIAANIGTIPVVSCVASSSCSNVAVTTPRMVIGTGTLNGASPSSVTISGISPAFTSSGSFFCTLGGEAGASTALYAVTNLSGSSFQIAGPNTSTTSVNYICMGN
jgi:hypothetical protein